MSLKQIAVNGIWALATTFIGYYGEQLQLQAIRHEVPYELYMGHMSDLFLPSSIVSLGATAAVIQMHRYDKSKKHTPAEKEKNGQTLDTLIMGTAGFVIGGCTFVEWFDSYTRSRPALFDWKDVGCYVVGAVTAYGVYRVSRCFE